MIALILPCYRGAMARRKRARVTRGSAREGRRRALRVLLDERSYPELARELQGEQDQALRREFAMHLFTLAVRGPGGPDGRWVDRLLAAGLHRTLTDDDIERLGKAAYSGVASALEANIAARVCEKLRRR